MPPDPPSRLLYEIKGPLYTYVLLGPLVAALFAQKIDNELVSCLAFVAFVGIAFHSLRRRLNSLEQSVREIEEELQRLNPPPSEWDRFAGRSTESDHDP
ncbi:MAG: hypothetical protein AB1646_20385 [Thermodesulfobacteriota bacterium]